MYAEDEHLKNSNQAAFGIVVTGALCTEGGRTTKGIIALHSMMIAVMLKRS